MRHAIIAAVLLSGIGLAAQDAPVPPVTPAWDVVVIKRNTSGDNSMSAGSRPGGVYTLTNGSIRTIFSNAYPSQSNEIIGAPDWFASERYDLTGRITGKPTREQEQELWRSLFAERMKLKAHYETREQPTYALVLARSDGRLGPNIKRSPTDCAARTAAFRRGEQLPPPPPAANGMPACSFQSGGGILRSGGQLLANLGRSISGIAGRMVVDQTGLPGDYEFTLEFSTQQAGAAAGDERPNLFTALQEQLGLKLEPTRSPVELVVIDHIERPIVD